MIHKYTADEARNLKTYGELKSDFQINEAAADGEGGSDDEEGGVEFEEADIDDICEYTSIHRVGSRLLVSYLLVPQLPFLLLFPYCSSAT